MPLEACQHGRHLVAEGNRHRLLQIAAAGHRRIAVFARQRGERARNGIEIRFDQSERFADLHHGGAVGDVLGGRAPMAPLAEPVAAQRDELLHHRQHRIADALGLPFELGEIDLGHVAMPADFVGSLLRNNAEPALRPRQRALKVEIFLDAGLVGKHPPHRLGRKDVAEHGRVDQ